jgi:hypothetical protein
MTNKSPILVAIAGLTIALTSPAQASSTDPNSNLIQNPDFTSTNQFSSPVQLNVAPPGGTSRNPGFSRGADIGPWTDKGFVLLFGPNPDSPSGTNADFGSGADNQFAADGGGFCLYGPGNCGQSHANGLEIGPSDGNFLALDGTQGPMKHSGAGCIGGGRCAYDLQSSISQTITGLKVGVPTTVEFNWAAGQQTGFPGSTTEQLQVSLCPTSDLASCPTADKLLTAVLDNPHAGFQDWDKGVTQNGRDFTFDPSMPTEVLTFLAIGTPSVEPPFVLIDGRHLSLTQHSVPEPGTGSLLLIGLAAMAGVAYRRRRRRDPAQAGDA